jgi:hypothetical protein
MLPLINVALKTTFRYSARRSPVSSGILEHAGPRTALIVWFDADVVVHRDPELCLQPRYFLFMHR